MKLISYRNNKHKLSIQIFSDENNSDLPLIFLLIFSIFFIRKKWVKLLFLIFRFLILLQYKFTSLYY